MDAEQVRKDAEQVSVPAYSRIFHYRTFLQTLTKSFQLWVRDESCSKNTDIVY